MSDNNSKRSKVIELELQIRELREQVKELKHSEFEDSYSVLLTKKCQRSVKDFLNVERHATYIIQTVGTIMRRFVLSKLGLELNTRFLYSDEYENALNIISSDEYHKVLLKTVCDKDFIQRFYKHFGYEQSVEVFKFSAEATDYINSLNEGEI